MNLGDSSDMDAAQLLPDMDQLLNKLGGSIVPVTMEQLRAMRAMVYGECTDANWKEVELDWARPDSVKWLNEKIKQPLKDYSKKASRQ